LALFPSTRPGGANIMRTLMTALDPHHVLNPGRYEVTR
jgi:FAD/FMN-containing dehydrogenase